MTIKNYSLSECLKNYFLLFCFLLIISFGKVYAAQNWNIQTIDNSGNPGDNLSVACDSSGNPQVVYRDVDSYDSKYAIWTGKGWNIQRFYDGYYNSYDSYRYCQYHSLKIDPLDIPHCAYALASYSASSRNLYYAVNNGSWIRKSVRAEGNFNHCQLVLTYNKIYGVYIPHILYSYNSSFCRSWYDPATENWKHEEIDPVNVTASISVKAVQQENTYEIFASYYDFAGKNLKFAYYDGNEWSSIVVDSVGDVGKYNSLDIDSNGTVHIGYYDADNKNLKHAELNPKG